MNRRDAIAAIGALGAMGNPASLLAQTASTPRWRVGFLFGGSKTPAGECQRIPREFKQWFVPLLLEDFGMVEGRDFALDFRCVDGKPERAADLAREIVAANPDVIVVYEVPLSTWVQRATDTIPIVMAFGPDPVVHGWAKSYARPGGNLTGSTWELEDSFVYKTWELIREVHPKARTFVYVEMVPHPLRGVYDEWRDRFGKQFGVKIHTVGISEPAGIKDAFRKVLELKAEAFLMADDPFTRVHRAEIMKEAVLTRVPIYIWSGRNLVERWQGALMSIGTDFSDQPRRAAEYVSKILRGTKPGDLPIVRPVKSRLEIDLRVARELGIRIPQAMLLRADKVIE